MDTYQTFLVYALIYRLAIIIAGISCVIVGYKLFMNITPGTVSAQQGSDLDAEYKDFKLSLRNAAPGTFFSLFGVVLISLMIIQGSPELVLENMDRISFNDRVSDSNKVVTDALAELERKTEQISGNVIDAVNANVEKKLKQQETQFSEKLSNMRVTLRSSDQVSESIITIMEKAKQLTEEKRLVEARREYRRAVYSIAEPMNAVAWFYFKNGELAKAHPIAQYAVDLVPDEANFLDTRAEISFALGNKAEAIELMEKAAALDESYREKLNRFKLESGSD